MQNLPKLAAGQRYNRLVAIEPSQGKKRSRDWLFQCDCGESKVIDAWSVRAGTVKGCGCGQGGFHGKGGKRPHPSLAAARLNGETQYNTGKICKNGHRANRWTCSGDCIECERARPHAQNRLAREYGLKDWNDVIEMKAMQNNRCIICQDSFEDSKNTHIDHCHLTKKVRGLLCRRCNHGLGFFSDSPERLRAAALYIERSRA